MEESYGIGIANRFALFSDDDSDPAEALSQDLKKKTKVAEKENKAKTEPAKPKTNVNQKKTIKEATHKAQDNKDVRPTGRSNADGRPERPFNKFNNNNENREDRNNRRNRDDRPYNGPSENRPKREFGGDRGDYENNRNRERGPRPQGAGGADRRVGGGAGGARGTGPRRTFDDRRSNKREFDRQSGSDKTGVKPVDKRDGAGSHNWGSHKDVIDEADRPNNENDQSWGEKEGEKTIDAAGAQPETKEENAEVEAAAPVEEEPKELTLDEWKAQRAGRSKPSYNTRKAGEGEDPTQWKKMYELRKKEEQEESEEEEYDASEYPQRVGRQKHVLDIDIQFNDSRRPGGGGAGGRGRGQRQRGGGRGGGPGGAPAGERRFKNDESYTNPKTGGGEERSEVRRGGGGGGGGAERGAASVTASAAVAVNVPKVDSERDFPSLG